MCFPMAICVQQKTKENTKMKFYLNNKKISKKALKELIGEESLKRIIEEGKETFMDDPYTQISFFFGMDRMVNIEFNMEF